MALCVAVEAPEYLAAPEGVLGAEREARVTIALDVPGIEHVGGLRLPDRLLVKPRGGSSMLVYRSAALGPWAQCSCLGWTCDNTRRIWVPVPLAHSYTGIVKIAADIDVAEVLRVYGEIDAELERLIAEARAWSATVTMRRWELPVPAGVVIEVGAIRPERRVRA